MIELSSRQLQIIELVKRHEPITGDNIAELLGLSKPTLRADLSLLVMLGIVNAKPKVGYFLGEHAGTGKQNLKQLQSMKVREVAGVPITVGETASVQDAVTAMFLEDVGSLIVADAEGRMTGVVSRKDLLKVTLGNASAVTMPVSMVMTRQPNIVTIDPDESVIAAAEKMIKHEIDGLPVIRDQGNGHMEIIGRITKTTMTRILLEVVKSP